MRAQNHPDAKHVAVYHVAITRLILGEDISIVQLHISVGKGREGGCLNLV